MAKESSNHSTPDRLSAYIVPTLTANEDFLHAHAEDAVGEVVRLINDAIAMIGYASKRSEARKDYVERSMVFFLYHVLQPLSYAIYLDLIAANLPACFFELRSMLESLVKCYFADLKHSEQSFFQKRLESLGPRPNVTCLTEVLGRRLDREDEFVDLWRYLSNEWVHTKGTVDAIVASITEKEAILPWGLVVPTEYAQSDLDTIDELRQKVSLFRHLMKLAMEKYKQELDFSEG